MSIVTATGANQLWALDFRHDTLRDGRQLRVLTAIDVCTRECVSLVAGHTFAGAGVAEILRAASEKRGGLPARIQVDSGTEFTSESLDAWAHWNHLELDLSRPGRPRYPRPPYMVHQNFGVRSLHSGQPKAAAAGRPRGFKGGNSQGAVRGRAWPGKRYEVVINRSYGGRMMQLEVVFYPRPKARQKGLVHGVTIELPLETCQALSHALQWASSGVTEEHTKFQVSEGE